MPLNHTLLLESILLRGISPRPAFRPLRGRAWRCACLRRHAIGETFLYPSIAWRRREVKPARSASWGKGSGMLLSQATPHGQATFTTPAAGTAQEATSSWLRARPRLSMETRCLWLKQHHRIGSGRLNLARQSKPELWMDRCWRRDHWSARRNR